MKTISQAAFARMHGVSRKTVTVWKTSGLIVMSGDSVDVESSNARLKRFRSGRHQKARAPVSIAESVPAFEVPATTSAPWREPPDPHGAGVASGSGSIVEALPRLLAAAAAQVGLSPEQAGAVDAALRPLLLQRKADLFDLYRIDPSISCCDEAEAAPVRAAGTWHAYDWPDAFDEAEDLLR
jgi:hypothetical protein